MENEDWELVAEMIESADPKDKRLGELLSRIMRWIENEDTRAIEAHE